MTPAPTPAPAPPPSCNVASDPGSTLALAIGGIPTYTGADAQQCYRQLAGAETQILTNGLAAAGVGGGVVDLVTYGLERLGGEALLNTLREEASAGASDVAGTAPKPLPVDVPPVEAAPRAPVPEPQAVSAYRSTLPTRPAVGGGPAQDFQIAQAGPTEYHISGGGQSVWADTIDVNTGYAVDAKFVGTPAASPFVPGSTIPDIVRESVLAGQEGEFARYAAVIADESNPLIGLRIITNYGGAAPYFEQLLARFAIPGEVAVTGAG